MKKTAATMALLAGFGGGCANMTPVNSTASAQKDATAAPGDGFGTVSRGQEVRGMIGPNGEPVMVAARGSMPSSGVTQAGGAASASSGVVQAGLLQSANGDCPTCAHIPGESMPLWGGAFTSKLYAAGNGYISGGPGGAPAYPERFDNRGIMPVPGMGPPGAVAAVGALPIGGRPAVAIGRTSLRFTGPAGMKITWQLPNGTFNDESTGLTAPKEYNFLQGQTYRLRLSQILPSFPGRSFYPTLEVAVGNPKSLTYLAHNSVPLTFTDNDFQQARAGNLVVKVIYLPDRENQDFATVVGGAEELVSTPLEPGLDPVAEAQHKGTILAVVRLGNIDLENHSSPSMTAPPPTMMGPPPSAPPRTGPIMLPAPPATVPGPGMGLGGGAGTGLTPKTIAPMPTIPMPPGDNTPPSTTPPKSSGTASPSIPSAPTLATPPSKSSTTPSPDGAPPISLPPISGK